MDMQPVERTSYVREYLVGAGYLIFFCLLTALCSAFYYLSFVQPPPPVDISEFVTQFPPTTSTPSYLPTEHKRATKVIVDVFNEDLYHWETSDNGSKIEIKDGRLVLEALDDDSLAEARCQVRYCGVSYSPYFIRVDLTTNISTDQNFGVIFNQSDATNGFFLFAINTSTSDYYLYHHAQGTWSLRLGGQTDQIRPFPDVNTIGISIDGNTVEFFINGEFIDSYTEALHTFQTGHYGLYAGGTGFKLIVDNLVISR